MSTFPPEEDVKHPLLIDLVLKTIVKLIPKSSLPSCRLVCRKWNLMFLPRFQQEYAVKLNEWKSPEKFYQLIENVQDIPFHHFSVNLLPMNDIWLENIFELYGHQIKSINLEMSKENMNISQFRELLLFRARNLEQLSFFDNHDGIPEEVTNHPKLFPSWYNNINLSKHYDLTSFSSSSSSTMKDPEAFPQLKLKKILLRFSSEKKFHINFLRDLFKASPHLEEIHFQRLTKRDSSDSDTKLLIMALTDCKKWDRLTCLHLGQVENQCLVLFNSLHVNHNAYVRLKKFSFEYLVSDVQAESLETFFQGQASYFEELTLNEYRGRNHLIIAFPTFEKLNKLSITAFDQSQILPSQPISYPSSFPVLETLLFYGVQNMISWNDFFPLVENGGNVEGSSSLRHLQAPYRMKNIEYLKRLYDNFPSITSLDITSPSNAILTELWRTWKNLQVLEVFLDYNNVNVDTAFTGMSILDSLETRQQKSFKEGIHEDNIPENSIRNLKNLRKFVCEMWEPWRREDEAEVEDITCLFSDISGYRAFYHMPQLQSIYIARSFMSKECVKSIQNQLPLFTHIDIRGPVRQKLN